MLIRFERTIEDIMVFKDYHLLHTKYMKRFAFLYRWIGALLIVAFFLFFGPLLAPKAPLPLVIVPALIAAGLFAANSDRIIRRQTRSNRQKILADAEHTKFVGQQELELTDTGLRTRSDYFEAKLAWEAIERIETTPEHTFIYLNTTQAYIVPHQKILDGDGPALLAELRRRCQPEQRLQRTSKGTN